MPCCEESLELNVPFTCKTIFPWCPVLLPYNSLSLYLYTQYITIYIPVLQYITENWRQLQQNCLFRKFKMQLEPYVLNNFFYCFWLILAFQQQQHIRLVGNKICNFSWRTIYSAVWWYENLGSWLMLQLSKSIAICVVP